MDIEAALVAYLSEKGLDVFADVPEDRPDTFVTVERTGGGWDRYRNNPTVAVQCWAKTRLEASELSQKVLGMLDDFRYVMGVCRVDVDSVYNFPAEKGEPRYQIVCDVITR